MAPQEIDDSGGKGVVRIAHDHMRGICDVRVFCMRGKLSQMRNGLVGNKITRSAADEMQRKCEIRRGLAQLCRLPVLTARVASFGSRDIADESGVPMPVKAAILLFPQIALEAIACAASGTMRHIASDHVRRLLR